MKLIVLTDNSAGTNFGAEHGLSYLVESSTHRILFDTGHSDLFIKNALILGIDIVEEVRTVVLSHGHWDHGNGLKYLRGQTLITNPQSFIKRYRKHDNSYVGLGLGKEEVSSMFKVKTSMMPYPLTENILFLGEIPRSNSFESQTTSFVDGKNRPDFIPDDSALAIIEDNELVIISGCSHSGICNIINYAMQVTGISMVKAVIGGLHLKHNSEQTRQTVRFLKDNSISNIYPAHCTGFEAMVAFAKEFDISQLKTGTTLTL